MIDPRIAYERVPLADGENAYPLWQEAARLSVPEPPTEDKPGESSCESGSCGRSWSDESPDWPNGSEGERMVAWIDANEEALGLFDEGIERGRLQFPHATSPEDWNHGLDQVWGLRNLVRARTWRIRRHVIQRAITEASQEAIRLLHFGDMFCNGEGMVVHYLCGTAYRGMGIAAIGYLARQDCSTTELKSLLAAVVESLHSPDGLAQAEICDYCQSAFMMLRKMPDNVDDVEAIVDTMLATFYSNGPGDFDGSPIGDINQRLTWRRQSLLELLRGHSQPFDKSVTIELMQRRLAVTVADLRSPLPSVGQRAKEWFAKLAPWTRQRREPPIPYQLTPYCPISHVGDAPQTHAAISELFGDKFSLRFGGHFRPVTSSSSSKARKRIQSVRNPIGQMLVEHLAPSSPKFVMLNRLVNLEALKAIIALRLYELETSDLPRSLDELVRNGLVATIPHDPYSGRSFRYCPTRRIVWSVGRKGENRRGNLLHEAFAPGHTLRWEIPALSGD